MSWYVYIAKAKTGGYYTGMTQNPEQRLARHNSGTGSRFAAQQGPFEMVYVSPAFINKSDARKREIQVKDWSQIKKQKLIKGDFI